MKILLVGEGKNELGEEGASGSLEALVRRLGHEDSDIEVDRISNRSLHATHGTGKGYFKRAVRWILEAKKSGYDSIVLVVDEDGKSERRSEITEAQAWKPDTFPRALGVAIRTFDAWMLADESALSVTLETTIQRQQSPERINDPKENMKQLRDSSAQSMSLTELYASIASQANLEILEERCPDGFLPFAKHVHDL